ncbi:hypothetical protein JCM19238_3253 [Vibrio ponticus]|nr:hypothetical protein JCM19238_3253 [Vibrio ponticus]
MILKYINRSKNSIKLAIDSVLKILSGLVIVKIVSNSYDASLLANFSQLKMLSALFVSLTSSFFIVGLNKLSLKYNHSVSTSFVSILGGGLVFCGFWLCYFFEQEINDIIGKELVGGLLFLIILLVFGYLSNFLIGLSVREKRNVRLANARIIATLMSFLLFVVLNHKANDIWFSLAVYLLSYYMFLSCFLYQSSLFRFLKSDLVFDKNIFYDFVKIYVLTVFSSIVFPICIVYFRYSLSEMESWQWVSAWEIEWQLSSLVLLVLSPVLSLSVTTYFTEKLRKQELSRTMISRSIVIFSIGCFLVFCFIYNIREYLIKYLFNTEIMNKKFESSFIIMMAINFFRIISVFMFFILYIILDPRKLIVSEVIFGISFYMSLNYLSPLLWDHNFNLLVPVVLSFIYLVYLLFSSDFFNKNDLASWQSNVKRT